MSMMQRIGRLLGWGVQNVSKERPQQQRRVLHMGTGGVYVNEDTALTHAAVWAAVTLLSRTMLMCDVMVTQTLSGGRNERRRDLPLDWMLSRQPNPEMSAATFWHAIYMHKFLQGNAYAWIERDRAGRPMALWPVLPSRVDPMRDENERLIYRVSEPSGASSYLDASEMFHLRGPSWDGIIGLDPIRFHARQIGAGLAAEEYTQAFYSNGAHLSGGLFFKDALTPEARERIRAEYAETYTGPSKAHKMAVFSGGAEWKQFAVHPEAAQLIETRKFDVNAIARMYGVPPHMIGDLERATLTNVEEQSIEYVSYRIEPEARELAQEATIKLLTRGLSTTHEIRVDTKRLTRGRVKDRAEAAQIGRSGGWLNVNDIREEMDLDPVEGAWAEEFLIPLNHAYAEPQYEIQLREAEAGAVRPADPVPLPAARATPRALLDTLVQIRRRVEHQRETNERRHYPQQEVDKAMLVLGEYAEARLAPWAIDLQNDALPDALARWREQECARWSRGATEASVEELEQWAAEAARRT